MTKIRSGDSSMIDDRRGSGGGGFGGWARWAPVSPMKAGGGCSGIIVLLASLFLPKLLGGGDRRGGRPAATGPHGTADRDACNNELEQIVCGATNDVQAYWQANLPKFYNANYQVTKTVFFTDGVDTGCGQATSQTGPFYCPADHLVYIDLGFMQQLEQQLVGNDHRPRRAVHRRPRVRAPRPERARHQRPGAAGAAERSGSRQPVLRRARAAGRLLRRHVGRRRRRARSARHRRRDQRGARRRGGCRRRPHPGEDAGPDRPERRGRTARPSSARRGSRVASTPATRQCDTFSEVL